MTSLEISINSIEQPNQLCDIIQQSKNITTKCDSNDSTSSSHQDCYLTHDHHSQFVIPQCSSALVNFLIKILASRPYLIDDSVKNLAANYFKENNLKAQGLISQDVLRALSSGSGSQIIVWIHYEALLSHLIKENVYEPKTVANETLRTVKHELDPKIAAKFSSVLNSCVRRCREIDNRQAIDQEQEEEEKWCEIIDWMSWFLIDEDSAS